MEKIKIGVSDYTREQIQNGAIGIGSSNREFLDHIKSYEDEGYTVEFQTSLFRKIFLLGLYKIIAIK